MGAGKTTTGRRLAERLGLAFADADAALEADTGRTVAELIESEGESGFRRREIALLDRLTRQDGIVLATGGGAPLAAESRRRLRARGVVAYLRAGVDAQLARLEEDDSRPLLQGVERRATLQKLAQERAALYADVCHFSVDTDGRDPETVVETLLRRLAHVKQRTAQRARGPAAPA